jgi:mono/diheme cytochrome c family protein
VARAAVLLATALLLGALLFARLVRDDGPAAGDDAFQRRCGSCHTREAIGGSMRVAGPARDELQDFLRGHADASDDEIRQILDDYASGRSPGGG